MAFRNPNMVISVTREEFEDLKENVNKLSSDVAILKKGIKENVGTNEILNSDAENKNVDSIYSLADKNINTAKLAGAPRIEYFALEDKTKNSEFEDIIEQQNQNSSNEILDEITDITNINDEDVSLLASPTDNIIDISQIIAETNVQNGVETNIDNNLNSELSKEAESQNLDTYTLKMNFSIQNAKTNSGHRVYYLDDLQVDKIMNNSRSTLFQ